MRRSWQKFGISIIVVIGFSAFILSGCGSSQEKIELTGFLETYEKLINEYTASFESADKEKKAKMADQIKAMTTKWVEKRNEYNDQITPQAMDELVKEYDRITTKYSEFNKTHLG